MATIRLICLSLLGLVGLFLPMAAFTILYRHPPSPSFPPFGIEKATQPPALTATMDDVSLKQKQTDDKDLDNLIFNGEKEEATAKENQQKQQTHDGDSDSDDKKSTASAKSGDRSSIGNVLPVDKLKNGANTASKVLGQTFSMFKEKSGAALEAAKSSNAGKTIAGGLSTAATASQERYGKLKETDAFKKSSELASGAYERTSVVASGALEKARAASTTGLEMAKHTAAAGIETIKSKTGGKKGGE